MRQEFELVSKIETDKIIVGKRKDGIIHVLYKKNTKIDVEIQHELLHYYAEITGSTKSKFIFEGEDGVSVTKEARINALKIENQAPLSASVVFVQNGFQKLVAEFYLKINKPKNPYKVVSNFEEGIFWLNSLYL